MYSIYCEGHFYEKHIKTYDEVKLKEAYCIGLQLDYEVTYPDNVIKRVLFIK